MFLTAEISIYQFVLAISCFRSYSATYSSEKVLASAGNNSSDIFCLLIM